MEFRARLTRWFLSYGAVKSIPASNGKYLLCMHRECDTIVMIVMIRDYDTCLSPNKNTIQLFHDQDASLDLGNPM